MPNKNDIKKADKEEISLLYKVACAVVGLGIIASALVVSYVCLYANAYPMMMRGYFIPSAFAIAIWVVLMVIVITVPYILVKRRVMHY